MPNILDIQNTLYWILSIVDLNVLYHIHINLNAEIIERVNHYILAQIDFKLRSV